MAKIWYTPLGKPHKKSTKGLKRISATLYVGSAKVPGNQLWFFTSIVANVLCIFATLLYWFFHR